MKASPVSATALAVIIFATSVCAQETSALLENRDLRIELNLSSGAITFVDKQTGVSWDLDAPEVVLKSGSTAGVQALRLTQRDRNKLRYRREGIGEFTLNLLANPTRLDYSVFPEEVVREVRLLSKTLPVGPGDNNYYAAPYRMGIQLHPEGDKPFSRRFRDIQARVNKGTGSLKKRI
jgi:hypothetical protein